MRRGRKPNWVRDALAAKAGNKSARERLAVGFASIAHALYLAHKAGWIS